MISCEERNLINLDQRETLIGLSIPPPAQSNSSTKFHTLLPLEWKRYVDDIFSLWNVDKKEIEEFIVLTNSHHRTIKFTAEISGKEINFLDTTVFKGERFNKQAILDICKLSSTITPLPATHQGLEKGSSKVKPYYVLEQTLRRNLSLRIPPNSKDASVRETTPSVL